MPPADASPSFVSQDSPSFLNRVRSAIPPTSILILATVLIVAGAFTMWGPVNILAWRGGTFPDTEPDRPYFQANLKNSARMQYSSQPESSVYFGSACGASAKDQELHGFRGTATAELAGDKQDAFGRSIDCDGRWDVAFISWLLAASNIPLYASQQVIDINLAISDAEIAAQEEALARGELPLDAPLPPSDPDSADAEGTSAEPAGFPFPAITYFPQGNEWLVTGIDELIDAYRARDAFITDPAFSPQVGDLVFYEYPGGLGRHVNMVMAVQGDWVTVGGDEFGKIGLATMQLRGRAGILGYGATGMFDKHPLPSPRLA